jgi:hypothetical protein
MSEATDSAAVKAGGVKLEVVVVAALEYGSPEMPSPVYWPSTAVRPKDH